MIHTPPKTNLLGFCPNRKAARFLSSPGVPESVPPVALPPPNRARCPRIGTTCHAYPAEPRPVSQNQPHLSRVPRRTSPGVPESAPPVTLPPPHLARCPRINPACHAYTAESCPVSQNRPHLERFGVKQTVLGLCGVTLRAKNGALLCLKSI